VACADDPDPANSAAPLTPAFEPASDPEPSTTLAASGASGAPPEPIAPPGAAGAAAPVTIPSPTAPPRARAAARVTDAVGDVTPAVADRAPGWSDLAGAELAGGPEGFELVVAFGAAIPTAAPDAEHTMNVAAFVDVDGDGRVDYEVWANLGEGGWGGAWYDNRSGEARFVADSRIAPTVEAGRLVLRFPAALVGSASSFRWSVASEWGRYEAIGTMAAARDDAPDSDGSVTFPG